MKVEIGTDSAPAVGVLADLYYEDADGGDVADLEDRAIADVARDYPEHLTRITYFGKYGQGVAVRVFELAENAAKAVA